MKHLGIYFFVFIAFFACTKEVAVPKDDTTTAVTDTPTPSKDPLVGCTDVAATNFKATATTEDCSCSYPYSSKVVNTALPTQFQQYALIEEFTGTWCGWCPIGKETMETQVQNPKVVGVEVHQGDEMQVFDGIYSPLKKAYGTPAFPTGMVNRRKSVVGTTLIMGTSEWAKNITNWLGKGDTSIGIAAESILEGDSLKILTHLKFTEKLTGKYGLGIYLVETNVAGYPQLNYLSRDQNFKQYKAYSLPAEIETILHYNVARMAITPIVGGLEIPNAATQEKKIFQKMLAIKLPKNVAVPKNCKLIVFVQNEKNEILNVREVAINEVLSWN